MKFGVAIKSSVIPDLPISSQAVHIMRLAQAAEELGFDSIWIPDRTVFPSDISFRYPNRFENGPDIPVSQQVLEPIVTMGYLAGLTSKIRLGFGVVVLPFRHPVLNAKMVTTLDVLSGGRVIFGAGVGWMPEEFEGMSVPFSQRGKLTDEHIEMFKELCSDGLANYSGKYFRISGKIFYPKPIQQPHPPVWIGGRSQAAILRAARLGDGWFPIGLTPEEIQHDRQCLREAAEKSNRDPDEILIGLSSSLNIPVKHRNNYSSSFQKRSARKAIDKLARYRDVGLNYYVASINGLDTESAVEAMTILANDIVTAFN